MGSSRLLQTSIWRFVEQEPPELAGRHDDRNPQPTPTEHDDEFGRSDDKEGGGKGADRKDEGEAQSHSQGSKDVISPPIGPGAELNTTPSLPSLDECKMNRKGHCEEHRYQAKKVTVYSKKWKDRGLGKGDGYMLQRCLM